MYERQKPFPSVCARNLVGLQFLQSAAEIAAQRRQKSRKKCGRAANRRVGRRISRLSIEKRRFQLMHENWRVPRVRERGGVADVIEMTVGQNNRFRPRPGPEPRFSGV